MTIYDAVADLDLVIEGFDCSLAERDTSSEFVRTTTTVSLHGRGQTGRGEDVTYEGEDHHALVEHVGDGDPFDLEGEYTLDSFSEHLGSQDLFFGSEPGQSAFRNYRRWGFESAALDLALRQAGETLASALGIEYGPVRFVVSTRLGDPPTLDRVEAFLDLNPDLEFKLDPTSEWDEALIARLRETGRVRAVDLKGQYHGTVVDQPADPDLYRRVVEGLPDAVIEDPALTEETREILRGHEGRVAWDYPITGVESVEDLPWEPEWLNVKPSRFGSVRSLLATIEYCQERGIELYGGGQFELGVGREHLHAVASLFYPDGPNDVAPSPYNDPTPRAGLPESPLAPPDESRGLDWS
ncbi:enolase-like domain-containing protein [Natronorarus salvus]|uniref:hypothetical protein n=1 Tax=Natronorarus salvus TaxID=3117733 RepID=UPI002F261897